MTAEKVLRQAIVDSGLAPEYITPLQYFSKEQRDIIYDAMQRYADRCVVETMFPPEDKEESALRNFRKRYLNEAPEGVKISDVLDLLPIAFSRAVNKHLEGNNRALLRALKSKLRYTEENKEKATDFGKLRLAGMAEAYRECIELSKSILNIKEDGKHSHY